MKIYEESVREERNALTKTLTKELKEVSGRNVAERALAIIVTDFCDKTIAGSSDYKAGAPYEQPYEEAYRQYYPTYEKNRLITPAGVWPETFTQATIQACSIPYAPGRYPDYPPIS
ncbi:MAG TPA: hypothetical protein VK983_00220 [Candidatus Limnocylindrales bacterium]|nr:hypothetical protein [Candidatus Limnocylindrales bacterium]